MEDTGGAGMATKEKPGTEVAGWDTMWWAFSTGN
jgi:hypothetical protein